MDKLLPADRRVRMLPDAAADLQLSGDIRGTVVAVILYEHIGELMVNVNWDGIGCMIMQADDIELLPILDLIVEATGQEN